MSLDIWKFVHFPPVHGSVIKDINYGGIVGTLEPGGVSYWPKKQFEITFNNLSLNEVT